MQRTNLSRSNKNFQKSRALALAVAGVGALCNRSAQAANDAWSTNPASNAFTGSINWTTNTSTPGAGNGTIASADSLFFGNSTTTLLNEDETAGFIIGNITFNAGATSAYTIGDGTTNGNAGNSFALTGNISNPSGTVQTINAPITLSGNSSFSASTAAGNLTLGGSITGTSSTLTTNGGTALALVASNTFFTGNVSLASLIAQGSTAAASTFASNPTTTFNGNGNLTVSGNVVVGRSNLTFAGNSVANITGPITNSGATSVDWANVTISGSANVTAASVNLNGNGVTGNLNLNGGTLTTGSISAVDGYGTGTANITHLRLNGTQIIASGPSTNFIQSLASSLAAVAGTGATNEALVGNGGALINTNGNNITVNASLVNDSGATGFLTKSGTGTLTLTNASTYSGATNITGGTLQLQPSSITSGSQLYLNAATITGVANGGSVTTVADQSGNGRNATAGNGTVTFQSAGLNNRPTLVFNGLSNMVDALSSSGNTGTVFVVEQSGNQAKGGFLGTSAMGGMEFRRSTNNLEILSAATVDIGDTTGSPLQTTPQVIALTYSQQATGGSEQFYINGVMVASTTKSGNTTFASNLTSLIGVGYTNGGNVEYLTGNISAIVDYNTVLSASQIAATNAALNNAFLGNSDGTSLLPSATPVNISAAGASLDVNGVSQSIGSLTGVAGSSVTLGNGVLTIGSAGTNTTFAGNITDSGGTSILTGGSLIKTGAGTLTFSGINAYAGGTTISAGTLRANNSSGSATGTGNITVAATSSGNYTGGTLGGSGTVSGNVTLAAGTAVRLGGIIAAGPDALTTGTLTTTGNHTWNAGAAYNWKIAGLGNSSSPIGTGNLGGDATTWDSLTMGGLTLNALGGSSGNATVPSFTIKLSDTSTLTPTIGGNYSWTIGNSTTAVTAPAGYTIGTGSFSDLLLSGNTSAGFASGGSAAFALDTSGLTFGNAATTSPGAFSLELVTNGAGGDNLVLDYDATPEPGAAMLCLSGVLPMLIARRRRRRATPDRWRHALDG